MTEEGWKRLPEIVGRALELQGEERDAYLNRACAGDHELRAEVDRLLAREGSGGRDFLEPPDLAAEPGRGAPRAHLLGEFELLRELGRGGMGVVYLARQPRLSREVAVKVLVEGLTTTERDVERFHREARATARLRHPGIVQVFADGQSGSNHWFAMEYVAGHDLARELVLQRSGGVLASDRPFLPRPDEPEHVATIARLCAEVADALHHAHQHGLVHRDVKPNNLLLQPDGRVQIGDFGLVRDEALGTITRTGEVAGTPHYMSPEQARVHQGRVDHRTDVYSLGVVLYELATLQRPYEGRTHVDVLTKIRDAEPRRLRAQNHRIPRDLETICLKAMAKDPRDRYASAAEMRDDLRRFLAHEAIHAVPPGFADHVRRFAQRHRALLVPAGLLIAGLGVGAIFAQRRVEARALARLDATAVDASGNALPGRVYVRAIDSIAGTVGPRRDVGRLPLDDAGIDPGYYRIVIDVDGVGPRELTRDLEPGKEVSVVARVREGQRSTQDMVPVPAGTLALKGAVVNPPPYRNARVPVEAFHLARYEVSNREYREFLDATDHPEPTHWKMVLPEHDDLPVVYVSNDDARAYAEWKGMRLPTAAEWMLAACGEEGRLYPWPDAAPGELRGNVGGPELPDLSAGMEARVRAYLDNAQAVHANPDADSPLGIRNLFGNVAEWTETQLALLLDDAWHLRPHERLYVGGDWRAGARRRDVTITGWLGPEKGFSEPSIGFRCAFSADP